MYSRLPACPCAVLWRCCGRGAAMAPAARMAALCLAACLALAGASSASEPKSVTVTLQTKWQARGAWGVGAGGAGLTLPVAPRSPRLWRWRLPSSWRTRTRATAPSGPTRTPGGVRSRLSARSSRTLGPHPRTLRHSSLLTRTRSRRRGGGLRGCGRVRGVGAAARGRGPLCCQAPGALRAAPRTRTPALMRSRARRCYLRRWLCASTAPVWSCFGVWSPWRVRRRGAAAGRSCLAGGPCRPHLSCVRHWPRSRATRLTRRQCTL